MFVTSEPLDLILRGAILSVLAAAWILLLVRLLGLRAFSKMTALDFVVTIAAGSFLAGASQADTWPAFVQPVIPIAALMGAQLGAEKLKLKLNAPQVEATMQNSPVLLMRDGEMIAAALTEARVSEADLRGKLREAGVLSLDDVRAVVLETTGNVSVLQGSALEQTILQDVERRP